MEIAGIDISRYQYIWNENTGVMLRPMNFEVAASQNVRFVAGRITTGTLTDWAYDYRHTGYCSLKMSQSVGLPTTGYHVVRPWLPVDAQMSALFRAMESKSFYEDFPLWMDCERPDGQSVYVQTKCIAGCIEWFLRRKDYYPDIYTNVGYWNTNTVHDPIFNNCNLVVANYTTAKTPLIPREWNGFFGLLKRWRIWQYSADGNGLGAKYGAASHSIDLNRFNGDENAFKKMLFSTPVVVEPPQGDQGDNILQTKFVALVDRQAVRTEPSTAQGTKTVSSRLAAGTILYPAREAFVKGPGEMWMRFDEGWVAVVHGGNQYLKSVAIS